MLGWLLKTSADHLGSRDLRGGRKRRGGGRRCQQYLKSLAWRDQQPVHRKLIAEIWRLWDWRVRRKDQPVELLSAATKTTRMTSFAGARSPAAARSVCCGVRLAIGRVKRFNVGIFRQCASDLRAAHVGVSNARTLSGHIERTSAAWRRAQAFASRQLIRARIGASVGGGAGGRSWQ
jgi:hypothetical protein